MAQESWKREKDGTDCKIPEGLILCINNCGLFGSPTTMNMCSKCYNESLLKKPNPPTPSTAPSPSLIQSSSTPPILSMSSSSQPKHELLPESSSSPSSSLLSSALVASRQQIEEKNVEREKAGVSSSPEIPPLKTGSATGLRCNSCQRRVGLTGFRCRCGDLFCSRHRYSDAHNCSYDYKAAGREAIARDNPVVKAAKIIRI